MQIWKCYLPLFPTPFFPRRTSRTQFVLEFNNSRAFVELLLRDNKPDIIEIVEIIYKWTLLITVHPI